MDTLEIVPVGHWSRGKDRHADLTALQHDEPLAEWVRLTEEKLVSAQFAPKLSARGRTGEGRPLSGINAAVRELGRMA